MEKQKRIIIEIDQETRDRLKVLAAIKRVTMKELIRELLNAYESQT
jgi:hypothetical protein